MPTPALPSDLAYWPGLLAWLLGHGLSWLAPALALALVLTLASLRRKTTSGTGPLLPWWARFMVLTLLGAAVLLAGLWLLGSDGRMATYMALVLVCASGQWLLTRGWR